MPDKVKVVTDVVNAIYKAGVMDNRSIDMWIYEITEAYDRKCLFYLYEDDKLLGFFQGFRVPEVPKSQEDALRMFLESNKPQGEGNIGIMINLVILEGGLHTVNRLVAILERDHPNWDRVFWRNRKTGKFIERKNIRRKPCKEIVES